VVSGSSHPVMVAHRGRVGDDPENSLEGLRGLGRGVGGVEIDVRLTADGVPVLMHDPSVDRVTDGTGVIEELLHHEVAELTVSGRATVPRLSDYLDAVAATPLEMVLVDVKHADKATLGATAREVEASPVADRCVLMVRTVAQLRRSRRASGTLRLGSLAVGTENVAERIRVARELDAELLLVHFGDERYLQHRSVVGRVHEAGLLCGASTINSTAAVGAAFDDGCDVIVTDVADRHPRA
jgi:glycerophosphoryl diester phosphodiesterase